nr:S1 RNA-binding domain-containing protein [Saprospiraceae bacterium]
HPWEVLDNTISEGSVVKGKIVNIEDYGAFLEIIPGVEGLIHVSEVNWSNQPVNARDFFTLGQEMEAKVVTIDRDERKMSLSVKQLTEDPWSVVSAKYKVGTRHIGEVKNLTPYGVFVELENGIGGMVHISDLSWTKRYSHPSEFTKVGEKIDVSILEVDEDNRKLSLGHKQLEENPWDTFENVFPVGSYHEATIVKKDDRGAVVQLPYGLEAYAPIKHIKKEDGSTAGNEEALTFKVIEFNRDDKRIIVSHSRYLEDIRKEADQIVESEKTKEKDEIKKTIKATQSKVELSTFGDIEGFSELKEQMAASKAAAPAVETVEPVQEEPKVTRTSAKGDDLKKVEGIGPKIEELLHNAGIITFADLSKADVEAIKEILNAAGSRYQMHDPTSWPMQAEMAANGEWDKLKEWQDHAKGGKIEE